MNGYFSANAVMASCLIAVQSWSLIPRVEIDPAAGHLDRRVQHPVVGAAPATVGLPPPAPEAYHSSSSPSLIVAVLVARLDC